jgi:hypothetical protein
MADDKLNNGETLLPPQGATGSQHPSLKSGETLGSAQGGQTPAEEKPDHPENYGFTSGNMLHNAKEGLFDLGRGILGAGSEILTNPDWFIGQGNTLKDKVLDPNTSYNKLIAGPSEAAHQKAKAAWNNGDHVEAAGHELASLLPGIGPWAENLGEQAGTGDVGGALAKGGTQVLAGEAAPKAAGAVVGKVARSRFGRSLINTSVGARGADVAYGNPALGILDEGINTPFTGDWERGKSSVTPEMPYGKTGGRLEAVQKQRGILGNELTSKVGNESELPVNVRIPKNPQDEDFLTDHNATSPPDATASAPVRSISFEKTIGEPIHNYIQEIENNPALTQTDKDGAIKHLTELHDSMHNSVGGRDSLSPAEALEIKRKIGEGVNWNRTVPIGDEIKPMYRKLYGNLNSAINEQVPEAAGLNNRLTNLYAAEEALGRLAANKETGAVGGILGGKFGRGNIFSRSAGHVLPGLSNIPRLPIQGFGILGPVQQDNENDVKRRTNPFGLE